MVVMFLCIHSKNMLSKLFFYLASTNISSRCHGLFKLTPQDQMDSHNISILWIADQIEGTKQWFPMDQMVN